MHRQLDYIWEANAVQASELKKWHEYHDQPQTRYQLSPAIRNSWERCERFKVDPMMKFNPYVCSQYELVQSTEKYQYLIDCSLPVMENLFHYVTGSGQIMALLDINAMVLKVIGDYQTIEWVKRANCIEGSIWAENLVGTNGANLSIESSYDPVSIFGSQHFCLFSTVASAVSAPIMCDNRKIGALVITGPFGQVSNRTLGMVVSASNHITSKLALTQALNYNDIFLHNVSEAIIILNNFGHITFINDKLADLFEVNKFAVLGHGITEMLNKNQDKEYFSDLLSREKPVNETVTLFINNVKRRFHINYNPIFSSFPFRSDRLILIQEIKDISPISNIHMAANKSAGSTQAKYPADNENNNAKVFFEDIIGNDPKFLRMVNLAKNIALSPSNVLLLGESGTGKDLMAQAIHNSSPNKSQPFLAINCAALPRELIASELFGYEEGAFTGAKMRGHCGKFELADGGTIFLDEIGDMPLELQATLLRVLEDKTITRLGGTRLIPVDVRVIAATNKDLEFESKSNKFRSDLFYRLGASLIVLPPLRERSEDILLLAHNYIEKICRQLNIPTLKLDQTVIDVFLQYRWPGNVRELQNVLSGAIRLSAGKYITYDSICDYFQGKIDIRSNQDEPDDFMQMTAVVMETEKQMILECLAKHNYSKNMTANALGISRQTLYRRMKQYQLY
jgi:transcriptional regulator with PAS, ATPase and Fis domain